MQEDIIEIELEEEPIELCKLLKVIDLAEGGGHAKLLIADGYVGVNGETCTQKRKKMYVGDMLHFDGDTFMLTAADNLVQREDKPKAKPAESKPSHSKNDNQGRNKGKQTSQKSDVKKTKKKPQRDENTGRKPISFG